MKIVKINTGIKFHYNIISEYICGIILYGREVKPIKCGNISFINSYGVVHNDELILRNLHVNLTHSSATSDKNEYIIRDEYRDRKLLLKKYEIIQIKRSILEKGLTLVPVDISIVGSLIKVKVAICKGKKTYEKKQVLKERDIKRDLDIEMKYYS